MISLGPILLGIDLCAAALAVTRTSDAARARGRAVRAVSVAACLAFGSFVLQAWLGLELSLLGGHARLMPAGLLGVAPFVTCLVGVVALAMSPLHNHPPRTLSRILLLLAIALAFLGLRHPLVLAALWALSARVAYRELRELGDPEHSGRLFGIYHVPSTLLVLLGAALMVSDPTSARGVTLLVLGVAVREAVFPAHSWFVRFVERAPMGLVVAFTAPQLGVYAQLELLQGAVPHALAEHVAEVGAATALVAAGLGLVQRDPRRALAYLMMSQTGLVAFGLESESRVGQIGAVLSWQVLALSTTGFAMSLAALQARVGRHWLDRMGGNFARTPRLASAFLVLGFASVGLPLTLGFVAEDLLARAALDSSPWLGLCLVLATALNGISVMRMFSALFTGSRRHSGQQDLTPREHRALSLVLAVLVLAGLLPGPLTSLAAPVAGRPTSPADAADSADPANNPGS